MSIKAVLIDFDGTCLQKDQIYLSLKNMHAIRKALEAGILVIPCTGRAADMFPPQIEKEKGIRYWVSSAGARVLDRQENRVVSECLFTPEESAALCRLFEGRNIYAEVCAQGKIHVEKAVFEHIWDFRIPGHHVWYIEDGRVKPVEKLSEYFLENRIGMEKANIYGLTPDEAAWLQSEIRALDIAWIPKPNTNSVQFFPKRLDKKTAVEALLKQLSIDWSEVMAIGDADLDRCVVEAAGIGVAVANAKPELLEVADYVVASDEMNGLAEAFERFL